MQRPPDPHPTPPHSQWQLIAERVFSSPLFLLALYEPVPCISQCSCALTIALDALVFWGVFVVVFAQEAPQSHDILVFMTGQEEIEALARTCRDIAKHLPDSCGPMVVIPLYASLPPTQQLRVFQPAPKVKLAGPGRAGAATSSSVSCCSQLADRRKHDCFGCH